MNEPVNMFKNKFPFPELVDYIKEQRTSSKSKERAVRVVYELSTSSARLGL